MDAVHQREKRHPVNSCLHDRRELGVLAAVDALDVLRKRLGEQAVQHLAHFRGAIETGAAIG
ncbi:hypothetical protein D3C71_2169990 [compost metagenome]